MASEPIIVPTASSIRAECNTLLLEKEKDFWMKKSEHLHQVLEELWDSAEQTGEITLLRKGKLIKLSIPPHVREGSST